MNKLPRVLILLVLLSACSALDSLSSPTIFHVEYQVSGSTTAADLSYENATGSSEQIDHQWLPWKLEFDAPEGQFLYISAQNDNESGTVTCAILLNGVEQKTATSRGAYTIATCSGRFKP